MLICMSGSEKARNMKTEYESISPDIENYSRGLYQVASRRTEVSAYDRFVDFLHKTKRSVGCNR